MANPPIGNNILEGPLGVVNVTFNNIAMGKTTADTEVVPEEDNKEIMYQQDGTKPQDLVPTGMSYTVNCTFGEITTTIVEQVLRGTTKSAGGDSMKYGRNIYISRRALAKRLILTRVDSEGQSSTDLRHRMVFYKASPEVTGNLQYGADTQRNLAVSFYCFYDETELAFGYHGYASSVGLTP